MYCNRETMKIMYYTDMKHGRLQLYHVYCVAHSINYVSWGDMYRVCRGINIHYIMYIIS